MLAAAIIGYILLIFPIFASINIYFSKEKKRLFFCMYFYGFVHILSGYCELVKGGVAIHLTNKFALFIPYAQMTSMGKSFKPITDFHFIEQYSLTEIGSEDDIMIPFTVSFFGSFLANILGEVFTQKKPYLKLQNDFTVIENCETVNVYCKIVSLFNILTVILTVASTLMEKMKNARKRKQN